MSRAARRCTTAAEESCSVDGYIGTVGRRLYKIVYIPLNYEFAQNRLPGGAHGIYSGIPRAFRTAAPMGVSGLFSGGP